MTGCEKREYLLWESALKKISDEDKNNLQKHLSVCENCREALKTIESILEIMAVGIEPSNVLDSNEFDDAVFQKIRNRERELRFARKDKGYMLRMYGSTALAAAVVAFMLISVSNLERFIFPAGIESGPATEKYDTISIELSDRVSYRKAKEPATNEDLKAIDKTIKNKATASKPPEISSAARPILNKTVPIPGPEKPNGLEITENTGLNSNKTGKQTVSKNRFSILASPVSNPSPDSVIINSIYLSDESIPAVSQQTRAFLPEVVIDSGMISSLETPKSVLVTVEKMPAPLKIVPPEYPVWAKKNGVSGAVWVKARVDTSGNVDKAEIISSNKRGFGFEDAALKAARSSKYYPAETNGLKTVIWVIYPVNFVYKKTQ